MKTIPFTPNASTSEQLPTTFLPELTESRAACERVEADLAILTKQAKSDRESAGRFLAAIAAMAFALFALAGCAQRPPSTYDVSIDPSVTADEGAATLQALDAWHAATGVTFDTHVGAGGCSLAPDPTLTVGCIHITFGSHADVKAASSNPKAIGYTLEEAHGMGSQALGFSSNTIIENDLNADSLGWTLLHEIGHELGLVHSSDADDLMFPSTDGGCVATISDADVKAFDELRSGR